MEWNAIPKTAAEVYPISFTVRLIRKGISMEQEENKNQIQVIRVTEEWQRAGVHYVRVEGMLKEFPDITLAMEFDTDTPDTRYTLVLEGNMPVATVRLHVLDEHTGKIERVVTVGSARKKRIWRPCNERSRSLAEGSWNLTYRGDIKNSGRRVL
jgi:hypothetical protein